MINFDDFAKVEIKLGKILSAEKLEKSEKLLKLRVDFGPKADPMPSIDSEVAGTTGVEVEDGAESPAIIERDMRDVVSGIATSFPEPESLVGKMFPFVTNLEPRSIMGLQSEAMILATKNEGGISLLSPTSQAAQAGDVVG